MAKWVAPLVVGGLIGYYTGMPEVLAVAVGTFSAASVRPVLGYLFRFLPQPKAGG